MKRIAAAADCLIRCEPRRRPACLHFRAAERPDRHQRALGAPESAVVGFAATLALELVFDTLDTTRKIANIPARSKRLGSDRHGTMTALCNTKAPPTNPHGRGFSERVRSVYSEAFPDGPERLKWKGITYVRIRPSWLRFTSYTEPEQNVEMVF